MKEKKNFAGQRFDRWTVLDDCITDNNKERRWLCRCDCGKEVEYSYNHLVHGSAQSCGCRKKENDVHFPELLIHVGGTTIDLVDIRVFRRDGELCVEYTPDL